MPYYINVQNLQPTRVFEFLGRSRDLQSGQTWDRDVDRSDSDIMYL